MKKKWLVSLCSLSIAVCCVFGFAGCDLFGGKKKEYTSTGEEYYMYDDKKAVDIKNVTYIFNEEEKVFYIYGLNGMYYQNKPDVTEIKESDFVSEIDGYPVTYIGSYGLADMAGYKYVKSITIPNYITKIGKEALRYCKYLNEVTLPENLTSIESSTFYECTGLKSIIIPDNVTIIKESAFENCNKIASVTLPSKLEVIEASAFKNCSMTSITFPNGLKKIEKLAFSGCDIEELVFPESLESIGAWSFEYCSDLKSITINNTSMTLGEGAFKSCKKIKHIYFNGTKEEWKTFKSDNSMTLNGPTVHCTDGDID